MGHQGSSATGHWSDGQITNSGHFVRAYFQGKPEPSPSPGPAPSPGGVKHCAARGGCECDCSWAASGKCGGDDGSCCYSCCCSSFEAMPDNQTTLWFQSEFRTQCSSYSFPMLPYGTRLWECMFSFSFSGFAPL